MSTTAPEAPPPQPEKDAAPVLAIALYIGALLGLYGVILLFWGAFGSPDNRRTLGHPFDLWWGGLMLVLGLVVAGAGWAGIRAARTAE
jgi:H+/Cl- antiporter ClcA